MEALLQAVLQGAAPLGPALDWALSGSSAPPPPELLLDGGGRGRASPTHPPPLRGPDFRVAVLNHVREQAELVLAAAEQEAGPSHPPTPEGPSKAPPPPSAAPAGAGAPLPPRRERQAAQVQRASRRLEPGLLLDDANFPSLGAPAKPPSPGVGSKKKKQGHKRTIVPAKVEAAAAHPAFISAPAPTVAPPSSQPHAALPTSPPAARAAAQPQPQQPQPVASTPPPPRPPAGPAANSPLGLPPAAAMLAVREGSASLATPKRRLIPTRIEGSSIHVDESFLLATSPVALPLTPSSRTPTAAASRLGGGRTPLQEAPEELQQICVQLRWGDGEEAAPMATPPAPVAAAAGSGEPAGRGAGGSAPAAALASPLASPVPVSPGAGGSGRFEQLMAGMSLGAGSRDGSRGQQEQQTQQQAGSSRHTVWEQQQLESSGGGGSSGGRAAGRRLQPVREEPCSAGPTSLQLPAAAATAVASSAWGKPHQPVGSGHCRQPPPQPSLQGPGASSAAWPPLQQPSTGGGASSATAAAKQPSPHSGISPQLRSRLEGEPSSGALTPPAAGQLASTPASGGGAPTLAGTPPTVASLGHAEGSAPGSAAPKFPSPMEAVFRRLDAKASAAAAAAPATVAAGISTPPVGALGQGSAWPEVGGTHPLLAGTPGDSAGDQGGGGAAGSSQPLPWGCQPGGPPAAPAAAAAPGAGAAGRQRLSPLSAGAAPALPSIAVPVASSGAAPAGMGQEGGAGALSPQRLSPQKRPAPLDADAMAAPAEPGPVLCTAAARLAELHAGLLRGCSRLVLAGEVDLLLNLLAVPASVRVDPQLAHLTTLWCGDLAQQYACSVLLGAGGLVRGLDQQLLSDLAALPVVQARFPRLHAELQQALERLQAARLHTEKAYDQVRSGGILSLFGLPAFTNDGRRTRSQEEQRRVSNRESCRDEWFHLMKEAAAQTHSFAARQLGGAGGGRGPGTASDRLSEVGSRVAAGGDEGGVLQLLQHSATDLLRRLRPDNFAAFAELFMAAVLQAAATGETIMDEELGALARKNLPKFQQLNQRMQAGQGVPGPSRGGAARLQHNQPMTAAGFGGRHHQQHQRPGGGTRGRAGKGGGGGGGVEEGVAASLALVSEFPRAQRLYVLFLEAADSHRLNSALVRCMAAKLKSLTSPAAAHHAGAGAATPAALGEQVVATSTLASFLSYLCFSHAGGIHMSGFGGGASGSSDEGDASYDGSHPVDVGAALGAAVEEGSSLVWTLPWVVRYLWFLSGKEEGPARSPYFRAVLAWLQWLRLSAALTPGDPWFGLAAFCLRSVLDEFAERMGPQLMPASPELHDPPAAQRLPASPTVAGQGEAPAGIPGALSPAPREGGSEAGSHAAAPPAAVGSAGLAGSPTGRTASSDPFGALAACDRLLDRRFVQLCCPALAHAQQLFRSRAGSGSGALGNGTPGSRGSAAGGLAARRAKKIRPTAPSGLAAARVALQVPAALRSAAEAGQDVVKLRLQRAFLEQYSSEEHKVKLKDLVDYAADVIGYNAATSALDALAQQAIDAAAAQLTDAAEGVAVSLISEGQKLAPSLEPAVRLYVESLAEQLIATTCTQVLQQGQQAAEQEVQARAVRAMLALTPPGLGEAVVGTAAAIVAEVAAAACAQRLLSQVPSTVRQGITGQIDGIMRGVSRGRLAQLAANSAAERGPAGQGAQQQ